MLALLAGAGSYGVDLGGAASVFVWKSEAAGLGIWRWCQGMPVSLAAAYHHRERLGTGSINTKKR